MTTYSVRLGDIRLSITDLSFNRSTLRTIATYVITDIRSGREYVGNDLQSGVHMSPSGPEMIGSLASFLSAAIEALDRPYSDNGDIFPAWVAELAASESDDISMLSCFDGAHDNNDEYAATYGECIWCGVREPEWDSDDCPASNWVTVVV